MKYNTTAMTEKEKIVSNAKIKSMAQFFCLNYLLLLCFIISANTSAKHLEIYVK